MKRDNGDPKSQQPRDEQSLSPGARRIPVSARETARDQLLALKLQLEAIGEDTAELHVLRALIETCRAFDIPTHLSVAQLVTAFEKPSS